MGGLDCKNIMTKVRTYQIESAEWPTLELQDQVQYLRAKNLVIPGVSEKVIRECIGESDKKYRAEQQE